MCNDITSYETNERCDEIEALESNERYNEIIPLSYDRCNEIIP